jgi:hypothetical protein
MGLDGAWSFHPYLAVRCQEYRGSSPAPRPPRRRTRRIARAMRAAVLAAVALLLAR